MEPKLKKSIVVHPTTQEEELVEEDRLSSLPDAILVDILSLMPLKYAISTAVLSHRWRNLWTQTTSVDIDCRHFKNLYTTLDQLFSKLTSSIIQDFIIRVPASSVPRSLVIGSWLERVCVRKVEKIKVTSEDSGDARVVIDTLPTCIFNTRSLVVLQLGCTPCTKLDYKLPVELEMHNNNNIINLPNLVELHLNLYASQCGLMAKLIKCCPLLEELWLNCVYESLLSLSNGEDTVFLVDISNANVKRLDLMLNFDPQKTKVVVDAPKLTSFVFCGDFLSCSFVRKPVSLTKAGVFSSGMQSLLPVICNVANLGARPSIFDDLINDAFGAETTTTPWTFPNLRELHLYTTNDGLSLRLNSFASVPARRLLLGVKTIMLKSGNLNNLFNLGKGVLSNAPVLESLVIQVTAHHQSRSHQVSILLEEALLFKELFGYPRISSLCQILWTSYQATKRDRGSASLGQTFREQGKRIDECRGNACFGWRAWKLRTRIAESIRLEDLAGL